MDGVWTPTYHVGRDLLARHDTAGQRALCVTARRVVVSTSLGIPMNGRFPERHRRECVRHGSQ